MALMNDYMPQKTRDIITCTNFKIDVGLPYLFSKRLLEARLYMLTGHNLCKGPTLVPTAQ